MLRFYRSKKLKDSEMSEEEKQTRLAARKAKQDIIAAVEKNFKESYSDLSQEALNQGVLPDKIDEFLKRVKEDTIKKSLEKLKEDMMLAMTEEYHRQLEAKR